MKKLFLFIIIFCFYSISPHLVHGQSTNLQLALVYYHTPEELQTIFSTSTNVLEFLEGEDIASPVLLGLFSESQISTLRERSKYRIVLVDTNADLSRYVLLWHPQEDKGHLLEIYGTIIALSPKHTLVKLDEGKSFSHEGVGAEFFETPLTLEPIATPLPREELGTANPPTPTEKKVTPPKTSSSPFLFIMFAVILVVAGVIGVAVWIKKRKTRMEKEVNYPLQ